MTFAFTAWEEFGEPASDAERAALDAFRALLPTDAVTRAWSNLTFIDPSGRYSEVDVLLLTPGGLFIVELKGWHGRISGNQQQWRLTSDSGRVRVAANPTILNETKAKRLAGLLRNTLAGRKTPPGQRALRVPYVGSLVVLHGQNSRVDLPGEAATNVYALDGYGVSGLGSERQVSDWIRSQSEQARVDGPTATRLVQLIRAAGFSKTPTTRMVGQFSIDRADPLASGPNWQDLRADHPEIAGVQQRLRLFDVPRGASKHERDAIINAATREFYLTHGLNHAGIVSALEYLKSDQGPALVFPYEPQAIPLLDYLRDNADTLTLDDRFHLAASLAEILQYAHQRHLRHRALTPAQVYVTPQSGQKPFVRVRDWMLGEKKSTDTSHGLPTSLATDASSVRQWSQADTWIYLAPEALRGEVEFDVPLDVYSWGSITYLILTGLPPATNLAELEQQLDAAGGLDPTGSGAQVDDGLAAVVYAATLQQESNRTLNIEQVLAEFQDAYKDLREAAPAEALVDPVDAQPGDWVGDRFLIDSKRGQGATGVAFEVLDDDGTQDSATVILKVGRHDTSHSRIDDEAEVLRSLAHPRIVELVDGPLWLRSPTGERRALVLADAGKTTLAQLIRDDGRATLEQLERFGGDLLSAVDYLGAQGVFHRDIKPANLAVRPDARSGQPRLVLFDFSLAREPLNQISSGTDRYLDPFLGRGKRGQYDGAAELFSVAVTLYEMATGQPPAWVHGDERAEPSGDSVSLLPDAFDPAVATELQQFFRRALAREVAERFDTPSAMAAAWKRIFANLASETETATVSTEESDAAAAASVGSTPLSESGLSARALSVLERIDASTVADLLSYPTFERRRIRGQGEAVRKEIDRRVRQWRRQLSTDAADPDLPPESGTEAGSLENLVFQVLQNSGTQRAKVERDALEIFAGLRALRADAELPEVETRVVLPTVSAIAGELAVDRARIADSLRRAAKHWAKNTEVQALASEINAVIVDAGGVIELSDAAAALVMLRGSGFTGLARRRLGAGVINIVVEALDEWFTVRRITVQRAADRPRAGEKTRELILLAATSPASTNSAEDDAVLREINLDFAIHLGQVADELVSKNPISSPGRVRVAFAPAIEASLNPATWFEGGRAIKLGVSASGQATLSSAGEVYLRGLDPKEAVAAVLQDRPVQSVTDQVLQRQVVTRFPRVSPLPPRPRLDALVRAAQPNLTWDQTAYVTPEYSTSVAASTSTHSARATPRDVARVSGRLAGSLADNGALTLATTPRHVGETAQVLQQSYAVRHVAVAPWLLDLMRATARELEVDWQVVLRADAQERASQDWQNLRELVRTAVQGPWQELLASPEPLLFTNLALLARYDLTRLIAEQLDESVQRPAARWFLVPRVASAPAPLLDGATMPVGAGGWLDLPLPELLRDGLTNSGVAVESKDIS